MSDAMQRDMDEMDAQTGMAASMRAEDVFDKGPPKGNGEDKQQPQLCMITQEGSVLLLADNGQMTPVTQALKGICRQGALHQFMDAVIAAATRV